MLDKNFDFNIAYQTERKQQRKPERDVSFGSVDDLDCLCLSRSSNAGPNGQEDQNKLLQLTAQCINYYNRYSHQKDLHNTLVCRSFEVLRKKVEDSFSRIIEEAQNKLLEIKGFLQNQQRKLLDDKNRQEESLSSYLTEIKEVHLTQLLKKEMKKEEDFSDYARTLEGFFIVMTDVEKDRFEDSLEECVQFIHNLVKQEIDRLLSQHFPAKMDDLMGARTNEGSFTFENNKMALPDIFQGNVGRSLKDSIGEIREKQEMRKGKMNFYSKALIFQSVTA